MSETPHAIVTPRGPARRDDLRNLAIVAHVDHGKTTLIDSLLRQAGAFRANEDVAERVMDSNDLEREKGITILAKNTSVRWGGVTLNIVDTPGHADFGGEVERALTMVDGIVLLVDAAEGPLPQTRFVLRKALGYDMPVILVINKIDRPDARVAEVVDEAYELFMDLDANDAQLDFPIVYCSGRDGWSSLDPDDRSGDLGTLCDVIVDTIPAPSYTPDAKLQAWVTNLDANPYLGRLALCRVVEGTLERGKQVSWCRIDGRVERTKVAELFLTEQLERVPVDSAGPGDLVAVAGIPEITIGETLADADEPEALPTITVDEPALSMTVGINTSPLAGRDGDKMTARLVKNRLDAELVGNVSIRVNPTDRPDAWEVQARGELQLAVLVETMRREGFELTVGKPEVVTREIDGKKHEPVERVTIDVPDEHLGAVTQLLAGRKGRMENMVNHGLGWVRLEYLVPARGLIGFRTEFLTETRGTGVISHIFDGYEPWFGDIRARERGSVVADRTGPATTYAMLNLQDRSSMMVGPGTDVYCGMIVGENSRAGDMDVNICREKKLTNVRAASADETVKLTPHRVLSLEHALEFIAADECVEVTPKHIRLRKVHLDPQDRIRHAKQLAATAG
ncbi:MAG: translational GTPase TypA [Ilumatobacter sp.]|uniref:translational GTPase TypA n=1 Tax=Ilumatobacter sp. TaxID=1967498 RepID=UPI002608914D|nr:translational GTPase TypA [Ilumatobacter sp.]MDJ0771656.1 translational GTPase TypA [Ilumatobacter sp.]